MIKASAHGSSADAETLSQKGASTEAKIHGQSSDVWARFRNHKGAVFCSIVLSVILVFAYLGPYFWRLNPGRLDIRARNTSQITACLKVGNVGPDATDKTSPLIGSAQDWFSTVGYCFANPDTFSKEFKPFVDRRIKVSWSHPLGTDQKGTDTLAWLIKGGQTSLSVGLTAMLLSIFIGTSVGVLAGYFRPLDGLLMRLTDLFLALPLLPLLLVMVMLFRQSLASAFGQEVGTFILIVVAIGATSWMPTARVVRGDVLTIKEREFVLASRSIGTRPIRIIVRHLLPNVLSQVLVAGTLGISHAIITESALSFLGLGFPSDYPSWGRLLSDGVTFIQQYPERVIWPGLAISLTVLSVNYIGDGLRDALDPRAVG